MDGPSDDNSSDENLNSSFEHFIEANGLSDEGGQSSDEEDLEQRTKTATFDTVDNELINMNQALDSIEIVNPIEIGSVSFEPECPLNINNEPVSSEMEQSINLGSTDIPRFSCACHKLNIVVRSSVSNQYYLNRILKSLSSFAATNRNNIEINKIFTLAKCRPKLENSTRYLIAFYFSQAFTNFVNYFLNCKGGFHSFTSYCGVRTATRKIFLTIPFSVL